MAIDLENVQGLIPRGYNYPFSRHLLIRFPDAAAGRAFLTWARPRITHGGDWPAGEKPEPLVNLGLTFGGLVAVGLAEILRGIDPDLVVDQGPTSPRRNPFPNEFAVAPTQASVGDPSEPGGWWNGRFETGSIHASLHLYSRSVAASDAIVAEARLAMARCGVAELVANPDGSPLGGAAVSGGRVHFGYVDGIGQPDVDWGEIPAAPGRVDLRNFLLGYDTTDILSSPRRDDTGDLFLDCCYMGFRWLSQDVPGFERYLDENAAKAPATMTRDDAREWLAAKLVGRWRDGTPLALSPDRGDPSLADQGDFSYAGDPRGLRCPFSAHIRVANPRDEPLSATAGLAPVPRLLRRGSSYGPEWVPGRNDAEERGLIGLFLCASLNRQFLQILRWMNTNDFSPVFDAEVFGRQDPLFGSEAEKSSTKFRIPTPGGDIEVPLPRPFVQSRGTAHLIIPSLSTLDRLIR